MKPCAFCRSKEGLDGFFGDPSPYLCPDCQASLRRPEGWREYLATEWWLTRRTEYRNRRMASSEGGILRCDDCSMTELRALIYTDQVLNVHHVNYLHLFSERDADLRLRCKRCHLRKHRKPGWEMLNGAVEWNRFFEENQVTLADCIESREETLRFCCEVAAYEQCVYSEWAAEIIFLNDLWETSIEKVLLSVCHPSVSYMEGVYCENEALCAFMVAFLAAEIFGTPQPTVDRFRE